jgi:hypothetical protein
MKKFLVLVFVLALVGSSAYAINDIQTWASLNLKANLGSKIFLGYRHEMRYKEGNSYLVFDHFDAGYKLIPWLSAYASMRYLPVKGVKTWRPMFNILTKYKMISNRFRISYKTRSDMIRFRNKTTLKVSAMWLAYEAFIEDGKVFRSRYYVGLSVGKSLVVKPFLLQQNTNGIDQLIYGADIILKF